MLLTIQSFDRRQDVAVAVHFHEAKTFAATALAIRNHLSTLHRAVGGKQLLQFRAGHTITQIPDVQPLTQLSISITATGTWKPAAEQERPRIALRDRLTPTLTPGPGISQYKLTPARRTYRSGNHFFQTLSICEEITVAFVAAVPVPIRPIQGTDHRRRRGADTPVLLRDKPNPLGRVNRTRTQCNGTRTRQATDDESNRRGKSA